MPDIAMCKGEGCLVRQNCYRHVAVDEGLLQCWAKYWRDPSFTPEQGCDRKMPVPKGARTWRANDEPG